MTGLTPLMALTISAAVAFGLVLTLPASLKVLLGKRLGVDEARANRLVAVLHPALIPLMLFAGVLCDAAGARQVVLIGSVLTALALFSLTLRNTYPWAQLSLVLVGLGAACLSAGSLVLMPAAFFPGGELPNREEAALNLGAVFFALGGLIAQPLADLLLRTVRFRWTLGLLALACLVPAGLAVVPDPAATPPPPAPDGVLAAPTTPLVWVAGLVYFLYAPVMAAVNTWGATYLADVGYRERQGRWVLSAFTLAFGATQLALAYLAAQDVLPADNEPWVILFLALLSAVALGNLAGTVSKGNAGVGLVALGAFLGPVFPTLLAFVFRAPELEGHRGTAYGLVFAVGALGSLALGPLVARSVRKTSVQYSFRILMLLALLLTAAALVLGLTESPRPPAHKAAVGVPALAGGEICTA
jgi:MFS family permease